MQAWRSSLPQGFRVGFAPTMGNLHAGHLSLVERAKSLSDVTVASIFVNPMQFGESEDLDAYPRTLARDLESLREAGAAAVFTPSVVDIYPEGVEHHTAVEVPGLTDVLCGASRAGHFKGVTTVVSKLFGAVRPDVAAFGAKDLQQVLVIKKMVRDLLMNTEVITVPTMREADGLAMSSRNGYLTKTERQLAPRFPSVLTDFVTAVKSRSSTIEDALETARKALIKHGFHIDYLEARKTFDLTPATSLDTEVAIFGAVFVGKTRLIDNHVIPAR